MARSLWSLLLLPGCAVVVDSNLKALCAPEANSGVTCPLDTAEDDGVLLQLAVAQLKDAAASASGASAVGPMLPGDIMHNVFGGPRAPAATAGGQNITHNTTYVFQAEADGVACLAAVNKYRAMGQKEPIELCGAQFQTMAATQARWDEAHGFQDWVKANGWANMCPTSYIWQAEAQIQGSQDDAVRLYFGQGPQGALYRMLMDAKVCVACGQSGHHYTHNLC